jgi:hypothetical protein
MKMRILGVFILVLGLAFALTWVVLAQEAEIKDTYQTVPNVLSATSDNFAQAIQNPPHLAYNSTITFTPAFTIYLSAVFKNYDPCLTTPTLISPTNESNLNTLIPLFKWNSGSNPCATEARMEISRDSQFSQIFLSAWSATQGVQEYKMHTNLDPSTTYYWRVVLICEGNEDLYSDMWTFTTGSDGVILPASELITPINGITTSSTIVTFEWAAVEGAIDYVLWISSRQPPTQLTEMRSNVTMKNPQSVTSPTGFGFGFTTTETQYTTSLWANNTFTWWVYARNDYAMGEASEHEEFTTPD